MADKAASIKAEKHAQIWLGDKRRIIKPSEIYNENKEREIMERSKADLAAAAGFFSTIGAEELDAALKRIEQCLKR